MLAELLASPGVEELCELRSNVGFMAVHGGWMESVTDYIAVTAAERAGASVYAIRQPAELRWHVPATSMSPDDSPALRAFLDHVDVVLSIHGFGAGTLFRSPGDHGPAYRPDRAVLLGGANRALAERLGARLAAALPDVDVVSDLDAIPVRLRGVHPANVANLVPGGGVQIECGPAVRGLGPAHDGKTRDERRAVAAVLADALADAAAAEHSDR